MTHPPSTIGVGVIGLGFMGRTHIAAYQAAANAGYPCRLHAVCDRNAERTRGVLPASGNIGPGTNERLFDPANVRGYTDPDDFFADPGVHLVSICTYTDTHADLAARALKAGKHVVVEKPVSLHAAEIRALAALAAASNTRCMPAMCMRFWPGWDWLRDRVRDQRFGAVRSASFQRLGSGPSWGADFYRDDSRSGGALVDLHIHDADFISWCFGPPSAVASTGTTAHHTTLYSFPAGPSHVSAEGAWDLAPTAGFRMRYLVNFELATAEFDLARTPPLVLHTAKASEPVALPPLTGYDLELRHTLDAIADPRLPLRATLDEAAAVAELLDLERLSMRTGTAQRAAAAPPSAPC